MNRTFRVACVGIVAALGVAAPMSTAGAADSHQTFTRADVQSGHHRSPALAAPSSSGQSTTAAATTDRLYGADRYATAVAASFTAWPDAGQSGAAQAVVLSRGDEYADALGGAALAGAAAAPLLLTPTAALPQNVEDEIVRVLGKTGTVYILGGAGAVSGAVESRLTGLGLTVVRLSGADRFETSVKVAERTATLLPGGAPQFVMATTGQNFPDGLAAGATAGGYQATVVLTRDEAVPSPVKTYLDGMASANVPLFAVGGSAAAAPVSWDHVIVGQDRYETAGKVATEFWGDPNTTNDDPTEVGLATGMDWPDALSGGAFMAGYGPLLLSRTDSLTTTTATAATAVVTSATPRTVQQGWVFGGPAVVGATPFNEFQTIVAS